MKTTIIICATCGKQSEKPAAEINRRKKMGKNTFFCNLSCYGKYPKTTNRIKENRSNYNIAQHSNNKKDEYSGFRTHMRRAKRRKHECNITLEHLKDIWTGRCSITGLEIKLYPENKKSDLRKAASLDRIDSNKGYVVGNVQWVSAAINLAKADMSNDDVIEWINEIRNNA